MVGLGEFTKAGFDCSLVKAGGEVVLCVHLVGLVVVGGRLKTPPLLGAGGAGCGLGLVGANGKSSGVIPGDVFACGHVCAGYNVKRAPSRVGLVVGDKVGMGGHYCGDAGKCAFFSVGRTG